MGGIIGFGRIGQTVMRRSRGFKMKVIVYDPIKKEEIEKMRGVGYRELDDLLKESDFITLHCALTKPRAVTAGPDKTLFVLDTYQHSVMKFQISI